MRRILNRAHRAFTLIEVMIAMMVIASGAVILYAVAPMAAKTGKMVGNYQQAASIVQHKIDQLRGVGYGRLVYDEMLDAGIIDAAPNASPYSFATVDALTSVYKTATGTLEVADYNANVKRITVTLTWSGAGNGQGNGSMSVQALIPKT